MPSKLHCHLSFGKRFRFLSKVPSRLDILPFVVKFRRLTSSKLHQLVAIASGVRRTLSPLDVINETILPCSKMLNRMTSRLTRVYIFHLFCFFVVKNVVSNENTMKRGNKDKRSKTVLPISIYCVKLLTIDYYAVFIIIIIDKIDRTFQDHQKCQMIRIQYVHLAIAQFSFEIFFRIISEQYINNLFTYFK